MYNIHQFHHPSFNGRSYIYLVNLSCFQQYTAIGLTPLLQGKTREKENTKFNHLMNEVGWFLFKLLILGYVEDNQTGQSFQLPSNSKWSLYVEVCIILQGTSLNKCMGAYIVGTRNHLAIQSVIQACINSP